MTPKSFGIQSCIGDTSMQQNISELNFSHLTGVVCPLTWLVKNYDFGGFGEFGTGEVSQTSV